MNSITYRGFSNEMVKIAFLNTVAKGFKSALKAGWQDTGGWMGSGKYTKKLPIGGKSLTVIPAGLAAPGVLSKEDPAGLDRSRTERGLDLAGNIAGGVAGMGAGSIAAKRLLQGRAMGPRMGSFLTGTGSVIGGIAGSLALPHLLTAPSRMMRERRQAQAAQQQQTTDPVSGYGS